MVDLRVEAVRGKPPHAARDQRQAAAVVDRRLVLGEHDQRRSRLVQPRVHPRRDLDAAREGQPYVNVVVHVVRFERAADLVAQRFVGGNLRESECLGGAAKPLQVLRQAEDRSAVNAQPFPDRVASLDGGIERADPGPVAVHQLTVDVDQDVAVAFVEGLEHGNTIRFGRNLVKRPAARGGGRGGARRTPGTRRPGAGTSPES